MTFPYIGNPPAPRISMLSLDLATALKHAFMTGRISVGGAASFSNEAWSEYAPVAPTFSRLSNVLAANADLMAEVGRLTALVDEARGVIERQYEYNGEGDCDCSLCHDARAFLSKIAAATEAK